MVLAEVCRIASSMRCAALCLAALLAAPAVAQDYSGLCMTPANYQGGATYDHETSPITCDQAMAHWTSSGNTLAAYDFSVGLHCPLESYDVKNLVNIVASYCCGTGDAASRRSACWADYSHLCADPSSYTPSGEVGGRQRRQREHRGVLRSDHGLCYFSRASLGRRRLFERLNCGGVLRRQRLLCHHGHPFLRVHLLRHGQLRLPLRHRRLRHVGRSRRFGGRRGVRFRRSLGISLKGSLRDLPLRPQFPFKLFI